MRIIKALRESGDIRSFVGPSGGGNLATVYVKRDANRTQRVWAKNSNGVTISLANLCSEGDDSSEKVRIFKAAAEKGVDGLNRVGWAPEWEELKESHPWDELGGGGTEAERVYQDALTSYPSLWEDAGVDSVDYIVDKISELYKLGEGETKDLVYKKVLAGLT